MSIELLANKEISGFTYQIFAKGSLVSSQVVSNPKSKRHVIAFLPKPSMLPTAKIVVYYFASNGEIVSDNVNVEFGNELVNFVSNLFKIKI